MKRRFRFSAGITIPAVLAAALCYSMSYWQHTRYLGKLDYEALLQKASARGTLSFDPDTTDWSDLFQTQVSVTGTFEHEHTVFQINRSLHGLAGVKVVTPLRLPDSETRLLVQRGFLPYADYRKVDASSWQPEGERQVVGRLQPSQQKAFFLAPPEPPARDGGFKTRWMRLNVFAMGEQLPYSVLPVLLEQSNQGPGFPAYDEKAVVPSSRHLNYTIQWASFGSFALGLALFLQFRRGGAPAQKNLVDAKN